MPLDLTPLKPPYYEIDETEPTPQPQIAGIIVGYITQSGTDAPTATYAINNTGATITFDRTGAGAYRMFANTPVFTSGKTIPELPNTTQGVTKTMNNSSTTQINFNTSFAGTPTDGLLTNSPFRVTIYQ